MRLFSRFVGNLGLTSATAGAVLLLAASSLGQSSDAPSLGDMARKQRQKQKEAKDSTTKPKKVVTNEDMPQHSPDSGADSPATDGPHDEASLPHSADAVVRTGEQWKSAIAQRKAALTDLKNRVDKLNSSIHFVEANAYRNGVEYNKRQAQKQQDVERMQAQYDEQKRDLEQMQENARARRDMAAPFGIRS